MPVVCAHRVTDRHTRTHTHSHALAHRRYVGWINTLLAISNRKVSKACNNAIGAHVVNLIISLSVNFAEIESLRDGNNLTFEKASLSVERKSPGRVPTKPSVTTNSSVPTVTYGANTTTTTVATTSTQSVTTTPTTPSTTTSTAPTTTTTLLETTENPSGTENIAF